MYAQTQGRSEYEMQQAMLISFKLICLCCFSAHFPLSVAFYFQICLSFIRLKKKPNVFNGHAASCPWYATINFLLSGGI